MVAPAQMLRFGRFFINDKSFTEYFLYLLSQSSSALFLSPSTTCGFDDVAVFNHEKRLDICSPPPAPIAKNSDDVTNDDTVDVTTDSTGESSLPLDNDDDVDWSQAEDSFFQQDDSMNDKEEE